MNNTYILKGKIPVPCNFLEWGEWLENPNNRIVSVTKIGDVKISTVFLGLDHQFYITGEERPALFETMIFKGEHDDFQERYSTWDEAEEGHKKAVELVKNSQC